MNVDISERVDSTSVKSYAVVNNNEELSMSVADYVKKVAKGLPVGTELSFELGIDAEGNVDNSPFIQNRVHIEYIV